MLAQPQQQPQLQQQHIHVPPPQAIFERSVEQQLAEDCTSPVLDSTVELLATSPLDDVDILQVPHRHTSLPVLQAKDQEEQKQDEEQEEGGDSGRPLLPHRKSISFYSFADLCCYEREREKGRDDGGALMRVCSANDYICAKKKQLCECMKKH